MRRAGFVLVGGQSARMGSDKALLPFQGGLLIDKVAREVAEAAGSVTLVGHPERYQHLPYPVIPDSYADCGPLGGIQAALSATGADWNLIVACDMPGITAPLLAGMLARAEECGADCLAVRSPADLPEPLCAVYHKRCLHSLDAWLNSGRRKAAGWLLSQQVIWFPVESGSLLRNLNTPEEWSEYAEAPHE